MHTKGVGPMCFCLYEIVSASFDQDEFITRILWKKVDLEIGLIVELQDKNLLFKGQYEESSFFIKNTVFFLKILTNDLVRAHCSNELSFEMAT